VIAPLRVLVVEDEPVNLALLRAVLERSSVERLRDSQIVEAATLADARQHLAAGQPFDLVILDVRLPDGSGLTLARELAGERSTPGQRVVVMSASVLPAEREAALGTGCDAFLAKPFVPTELTKVLAGLIA
jgi:CheY-like chemotaxis protein